MIRRLLSLLVVTTLFGCMPHLRPPRVTAPEAYRYADRFPQDSCALAEQWWELFGDTTLNRLVEHALLNNRTLQASATSIAEARAQRLAARAAFLPQVDAELTAEASYERRTKITEHYGAEPVLRWEIPLFGEAGATRRASAAAIAATVWNHRAARLALAAEVATNYFTLLQYERDLEIATRTASLRRESAVLMDSMFRYGMASGVELEQARSLVYTAEADIPRYSGAIERLRLALALLAGETPQGLAIPTGWIGLLADRQPEALPIGVPAELVRRRPDILEAFFNLDRAAAEAHIARSDRFPALRLTASGGVGAASTKGLTERNPFVWSAAASLVQPVVGFGRLRGAERAAVERYNRAAYDYEQCVLEAFSDVETALSAISDNRRETDRCGELVASYNGIVRMAHALYRNGMVDYLDVIDAERTLYRAQMQLVDLVAGQYINYVALCKALGGGWR